MLPSQETGTTRGKRIRQGYGQELFKLRTVHILVNGVMGHFPTYRLWDMGGVPSSLETCEPVPVAKAKRKANLTRPVSDINCVSV